MEDYGVVDPATARRLSIACQVVLAVHRALSGVPHKPCGVFYSVDGPGGWQEGMKLCGCNYPVFELSRFPDDSD